MLKSLSRSPQINGHLKRKQTNTDVCGPHRTVTNTLLLVSLHTTAVCTSPRDKHHWSRDDSQKLVSKSRKSCLLAAVSQCTFMSLWQEGWLDGVGCISCIFWECSLVFLAFAGLPTLGRGMLKVQCVEFSDIQWWSCMLQLNTPHLTPFHTWKRTCVSLQLS